MGPGSGVSYDVVRKLGRILKYSDFPPGSFEFFTPDYLNTSWEGQLVGR